MLYMKSNFDISIFLLCKLSATEKAFSIPILYNKVV